MHATPNAVGASQSTVQLPPGEAPALGPAVVGLLEAQLLERTAPQETALHWTGFAHAASHCF
jgi:hypothetical protein